MTERPEDNVVAWIDQMLAADDVDAWIDSQVQRGPRDDYSVDRGQLRCPWGPHAFHGTPHGHCPGSHLTREEFVAARASQRVSGGIRSPRYNWVDWGGCAVCRHHSRASRCECSAPGCRCSGIAPPQDRSGLHTPGGTILDALVVSIGGESEPLVDAAASWGHPPDHPAHQCNLDLAGRCVWASCPTNSQAYSLTDVEAMRGGFVRPWLPPVIRGPAPELQFPRVPLPRPTVRFWANGPDGFMQMVQGELYIREWSARADEDSITYEITASLQDPNEVMYNPQALLDSMAPDAEELPAPAGPLDLDRISMEVERRIAVEDMVLEGFQSVGTLDPDAIQFDTEREYDTISYLPGGPTRTIQTAMHHSVTMALSAEYVNEPLLHDLIFGGGETVVPEEHESRA